jgi:hypothetical protein
MGESEFERELKKLNELLIKVNNIEVIKNIELLVIECLDDEPNEKRTTSKH